MGMDVYGRNPSSEEGEYFRANIWSWRPIHMLIVELCSDLLNEEMLHSLGFNDGAGPESQEICTEMANRFDHWLEHHVDGAAMESEIHVDENNRFVDPGPSTKTAYETDDEHLKELVAVLKSTRKKEVVCTGAEHVTASQSLTSRSRSTSPTERWSTLVEGRTEL